MGVGPSHIAKANFEDIQNAIDNNDILINTLPHNQQSCLITNTKNVYNEESLINSLLNKKEYSKLIFISMFIYIFYTSNIISIAPILKIYC